jgi:Xaa-Pro dipeptidase
MTDGVQPITRDERLVRIKKTRTLMRRNGMGDVFCEPGSSVFYSTGMRQPASGPAGLILPVKRGLLWLVRKAGEEQTHAGAGMREIRNWREAGGELAAVAQSLKDRGASITVRLEEPVKYRALGYTAKRGCVSVSTLPFQAAISTVRISPGTGAHTFAGQAPAIAINYLL